MKKLITYTLVACLLPLAVFAGDGVIDEFTATNQGLETLLEWTINPGHSISTFHVQRSFDGRRYYTIADVRARANIDRYRYTDTDLFKDELHTYYYRIEAVMLDHSTELSPVAEVTVSFSGIKRTWGSIKAMFR